MKRAGSCVPSVVVKVPGAVFFGSNWDDQFPLKNTAFTSAATIKGSGLPCIRSVICPCVCFATHLLTGSHLHSVDAWSRDGPRRKIGAICTTLTGTSQMTRKMRGSMTSAMTRGGHAAQPSCT